MSKTFRSWDVEQPLLLPPSVQELVPAGHLAHFVRDTVRESLELSAILDDYSEERGYPPYHPVMMTALLLYAYCQGIYSSRRIARACEQRVDFMAVTARQTPDFRTISDFRKRHLKALGALFGQVLALCEAATAAAIVCASKPWSRFSARSRARGAFGSSWEESSIPHEGWTR